MLADKDKWNNKYSGAILSTTFAPFLESRYLEFRPGTVLDLASGTGGNSLFLAEKGYLVTALDISEIGLKKVTETALKKGFQIKTLCYDLEPESGLNLNFGSWDNILISHFKPSEKLWSQIHKLLNPGGKILLCTFNEMQHENYSFSKKYCLSKQEFSDKNPYLKLLSFERFIENGKKHLDCSIFQSN